MMVRPAAAKGNALLNVSFYGRLADAIEPHVIVETSDGCSIAELRERLSSEYPRGSATLRDRRTRAIVADAVVPEDYRPNANETVEFLPPVSGG